MPNSCSFQDLCTQVMQMHPQTAPLLSFNNPQINRSSYYLLSLLPILHIAHGHRST